MKKEDYLELKKHIRKEGLNKKKWKISLASFLFELICCISLILLLLNSTIFSLEYFFISCSLGLVLFKFFCLLHDAGHSASFDKGIYNTIYGSICSIFCLMPYISWREIHFQHHRWVGVVDKDPTQVGLLKIKSFSKFKKNSLRIIWKLCIPIPAISMYITVFWSHFYKSFLLGNKLLARKELASLSLCLLPNIVAFMFLGLGKYATYIIVPYLFMFFWFEIINFTHHSGLFPYTSKDRSSSIPLNEQDQATRTSSYPTWISILFAYNFNFHTEHHYFPRAPWHSLHRIRNIIKEYDLDMTNYNNVPFLQYSVTLRKQDPIELYADSLPD